MNNPNAAVAGGGTSLSVLVVWLLGHFHVALSAEDGAVIAGALATVVLFIGREGIKGAWRRVWGGEDGLAMLEAIIALLIVAVVLLLMKVY